MQWLSSYSIYTLIPRSILYLYQFYFKGIQHIGYIMYTVTGDMSALDFADN